MRARRHASRTSPGATESAPVCHEASVGAGLRGFPCTGIVKLEEAAQTTPDKKAAALTLLPVTMEGMQFSVPLSASSVPGARGSHCRMPVRKVSRVHPFRGPRGGNARFDQRGSRPDRDLTIFRRESLRGAGKGVRSWSGQARTRTATLSHHCT